MFEKMFHFKQFDVMHSKSSMKVGTDGVLLGALAFAENTNNILDIGTGCGLIALMIAQRTKNNKIVAIDIDKDSIDEANTNFKNSPFKNRLNALVADVRNFEYNHKFNLIVSNPPYYQNSIASLDIKRTNARMANMLNFEDLIINVKRLLDEKGLFQVILPANLTSVFEYKCWLNNLIKINSIKIKTIPTKPVSRIILTFTHSSNQNPIVLPNKEIILNTLEYKEILKDYLL